MTPELFVELFRDALWLVLMLVCAIVIPSLLVGLIVAIFQAATSINEQTLSFLPRLIVTILALMAFATGELKS
ncbi:flagellar biosynthesis protein FliQ [Vibrio astriarenae]|nr:flagellar biosynthesis protein FliQ [Vibrio sp. C7]